VVAVDVADRGGGEDLLGVATGRLVAREDGPAGERAAAAVDGVDALVGRAEDGVQVAVAVEVGERRRRVDRGVEPALRARPAEPDPEREALQGAPARRPRVEAAVEARREDLRPPAAADVADRGAPDEAGADGPDPPRGGGGAGRGTGAGGGGL
jgi:hypothetical protein